MRVLIANATGGGLSGGYRNYLRELLPRMAAREDVDLVEVLMPHAALAEVATGGVPSEPIPIRASRAWYRSRIAAAGAEVVLVPTGRWLGNLGVPIVPMVRNMEPLVAPFAGLGLRDRARNAGLIARTRRACRNAPRVIAVSGFVKDTIAARWKIPNARISVIEHGVTRAVEERTPAALAAGPDQPFLFVAGSLRPYRGLEDAIRALPDIASRFPRIQLVVAGTVEGKTDPYLARLRDLVAATQQNARVCWAGRLEREEMAWCMRHTAAFLMTSRVEACPNTLLEAMLEGAPCIATPRRPMPDFLGDAGWYYEPGDVAGLATAVHRAIDPANASERTQNSILAKRLAGRFTWERTVDLTVHALRGVLV